MDFEMSAVHKALEDLALFHDRGDYVMTILGNHCSLLGLCEDPKERALEIKELADGRLQTWLRVLFSVYRADVELFTAIKGISPLAKYRYILFRETNDRYKAVYYSGEGPWEISQYPNDGKPSVEYAIGSTRRGMLVAWLYL